MTANTVDQRLIDSEPLHMSCSITRDIHSIKKPIYRYVDFKFGKQHSVTVIFIAKIFQTKHQRKLLAFECAHLIYICWPFAAYKTNVTHWNVANFMNSFDFLMMSTDDTGLSIHQYWNWKFLNNANSSNKTTAKWIAMNDMTKQSQNIALLFSVKYCSQLIHFRKWLSYGEKI